MSGETVLTTGANSGIGLATVLEAARRGFHSVGTVRSAAKAKLVHQAARDAGVEVDTVLLEVTDAARCTRVIDQVRPWAVVNNAGLSSMGAIEDVSDAEARHCLETMVVGPMRLARLAIPHMREAGGGRVVNVSSIYGLVSTPLTGWYQASKHAIEALSDALRMEVAGSGIKVVLIEPGGFDTGIWAGAQREADRHSGSRYQDAYRRSLAMTRLSRPLMGDPRSCAKVIVSALRARRPRPRYLVGRDAQLIAATQRVTPTQVSDRVIRLGLGL